MTDTENDDGIAWWLKLLLNGVGTLAAILCTIASLTQLLGAVVTIDSLQTLQSVMFLLLAFILFLLEATIICKSFTFAERFLGIVDKVGHWHKAGIYGGICIAIAVLHFTMTILLWLLVPFATATLYGFVALGKKADRSSMMANARGTDTPSNVNYQNFD